MITINYAADATLVSTAGVPYMQPVLDWRGIPEKDADGNQLLRPQTWSQRKLFLEACEYPQITEGKAPALVAAKFTRAVVDAILAQDEGVVKARGFWLFEDDHGRALARAVLTGAPPTQSNPRGGYNSALLHCLVELIEPCDRLEPYKPEAKSLNGAESKALPAATA